MLIPACVREVTATAGVGMAVSLSKCKLDSLRLCQSPVGTMKSEPLSVLASPYSFASLSSFSQLTHFSDLTQLSLSLEAVEWLVTDFGARFWVEFGCSFPECDPGQLAFLCRFLKWESARLF